MSRPLLPRARFLQPSWYALRRELPAHLCLYLTIDVLSNSYMYTNLNQGGCPHRSHELWVLYSHSVAYTRDTILKFITHLCKFERTAEPCHPRAASGNNWRYVSHHSASGLSPTMIGNGRLRCVSSNRDPCSTETHREPSTSPD